MPCPLADTCENYSSGNELCQDEKDSCDEFECSCTRTTYLGSNCHGNYGKCKVCGAEGEI